MLKKLPLLLTLFLALPSCADTVLTEEIKPANPAMVATAEKDFATKDEKTPPVKGGVLFMGSSSIRRWATLEKNFPKYHVVNRGFGGSEVSDSVGLVEKVIVPHAPKLVVFYAGGNDLARGTTPEKVTSNYKAFVARIHAALPETKIAFISLAAPPSRWKIRDKMIQTNDLIQAYTKTEPYLRYVDIYAAMLDANGQPRPELHVQDQLHMNADGYAIWIKALEPLLTAEAGTSK